MSKVQVNQAPTAAFVTQAWVSFTVSFGALLLGAAYIEANLWVRAFLALAALYLATSCFTLAKVVRDQHETGRITSRVDEAKLERLLADQDVFSSIS